MIEQASFEVTRSKNGWYWQLYDAEVCIGRSPHRHGTAKAARTEIDHVRDAAAAFDGYDEFDYSESDDPPKAWANVRSESESGTYGWTLTYDDEIVALPFITHTSRKSAIDSIENFCEIAAGAVPVYLAGDESKIEHQPDPFEVGMTAVRGALGTLLSRGRAHRQYLRNIDTKIIVSGIRGKSSTVRRLDDVFNRRGYDTLTKITGNHPVLIQNGSVIPIQRTGHYTTLYENINVLREFGPQLESYTPDDVAIFENQGITEYTTRLINERFVNPDVVVIANVRQDHQDTLGKTLRDLARAFARTIPADTMVINGEQNPVLREYMREEIEQQGAAMQSVTIPENQQGRIGSETVYACNDVLRYLDMEPIPEDQLNAYLDAIQPEWVRVPKGRIFDGAQINDIESTEAIRQKLAGKEYVLPFVFLRSDRRSRTASFANYLNTLADRGLIREAHAGGAFTNVFASNVNVPVTRHKRTEDAGKVLDELLDSDYPVLTMGNTVDKLRSRNVLNSWQQKVQTELPTEVNWRVTVSPVANFDCLVKCA